MKSSKNLSSPSFSCPFFFFYSVSLFKKSFSSRSESTLANSSEEKTEVEAEERRYQTKGQEEEIDFKSILRLQIRGASLCLFVCTAGGAKEAVSGV